MLVLIKYTEVGRAIPKIFSLFAWQRSAKVAGRAGRRAVPVPPAVECVLILLSTHLRPLRPGGPPAAVGWPPPPLRRAKRGAKIFCLFWYRTKKYLSFFKRNKKLCPSAYVISLFELSSKKLPWRFLGPSRDWSEMTFPIKGTFFPFFAVVSSCFFPPTKTPFCVTP